MADDWLIWQLADSAFPAGSFAHSGGLEAAWQHGRVSRGDSLLQFIDAAITQAAHGALPFVLAAHREPERLEEWDGLCDTWLTNHVAKRASRAQGQSFLAAAERIYSRSAISSMRATLRLHGSPIHFAPVFGAVGFELKLSDTRVSRLFLFCTLRGLISSAVRLGIVGPMEGQALQAGLSIKAEQLAGQTMQIAVADVAQTAPILDLLQGAQDRLYSRLFQS